LVRPYDLYIRFLVTKGYSELDDFNTFLSELGLPKITAEEVGSIFDKVHDLLPKSISAQVDKKQYNPEFWKWMKVLDVYDLWKAEKPLRTSETAHLQLVYDINYDPAIRIVLRSLLIKKQKHTEICQDLNFKFSYMLRPEHIDLYERFFWNPARMTRVAWKKLLPSFNNYEQTILFLCLTEDLDTVKAHLKLPNKTDITSTYSRMFAQCNQKIEHYMRLNTVEANREARSWMDTVMQLGDKIKKYESGNLEDFGKALQMEFEFVDSEFPTPDEHLLKELIATTTTNNKNDIDS
jgi:hypothetical protein